MRVSAVDLEYVDDNHDTTSRVRTAFNPSADSAYRHAHNKTLKLECGDNAERLVIIDNDHFVAAGAAN